MERSVEMSEFMDSGIQLIFVTYIPDENSCLILSGEIICKSSFICIVITADRIQFFSAYSFGAVCYVD